MPSRRVFCSRAALQFVVIAALALPGAIAIGDEGPLIVDVGAASARKLRIAIPEFVSEGGAKVTPQQLNEFAAYFSKMLDFTGFVEIVPPSAFVAKPGAAARPIAYEEWATLKLDFVVFGKIQAEAGGKIAFEVSAYDIRKRQRVSGKRYSPLGTGDMNNALRRFGDSFFGDVTGTPGVFTTKVAFVGVAANGKGKEIFVSNFDGSAVKQITHDKSIVLTPAWSPDGLKLTFTSYRDGRPDVYVYSFLTKKIVRLTQAKTGSHSGAAWHPNGRELAFSETLNGNTKIVTARVADGGGRKVFIESSGGLDVEPRYSPDGKAIAFTSGRYGRPHIFVRDLATKAADRQITFAGWYNTSADWRPDGKKLAFAAYDREIDRYDIMIVNPDGTMMERLTLNQGDNEKPAWSPDGRFILFQSNRGGGGKQKGYRLFLMNRDGGNQRPLDLPLADATMPSWGPRLTVDDMALFE